LLSAETGKKTHTHTQHGETHLGGLIYESIVGDSGSEKRPILLLLLLLLLFLSTSNIAISSYLRARARHLSAIAIWLARIMRPRSTIFMHANEMEWGNLGYADNGTYRWIPHRMRMKWNG
jgi:hypothetical protein